MTVKVPQIWHKLPVSLTELCIDTTLRCGQSFRWRKFGDEWRCTLHGRILSLRQDPECIRYKATWPAHRPEVNRQSQDDDTEALLRHYFNLDVDLGSLYKQWSDVDPNFRKKAPTFTGVRILNQNAWEALVAFICSSNNNISRISQMVHKLCIHYGPLIDHIDTEAFHDFPQPAALTGKGVEAHLRELGFGYRAKYIADTARMVAHDKPSGWLESLRNPESPAFGGTGGEQDIQAAYKQAHDELLTLKGVGPKVADCVCLMGLGWGESVPVDTHVWQIAQRDYKFGKKSKTFNKVMYDAVGDHFRVLWGKYAGWAHSVLFTADLKQFAEQAAVKGEDTTAVQVKEETIESHGVTTKRKRVTTVKAEVKTEVKVEDAEDTEGPALALPIKRRRTRQTRNGS